MDTLVVDPFEAAVPAVFGLERSDYARLASEPDYLAFERGQLDLHAYARRWFTDGRAVDVAALERFYRAHYRWMPGMDDLTERLRAAGVERHALSNYGPIFRWVDEVLDLSRRVPWTFVSCVTGHRKPEPDAYLHAAHTLGVPPDAIVLVDDREINCAGARAVGMGAIRFQGAAALERDLVALGVPIAASPPRGGPPTGCGAPRSLL